MSKEASKIYADIKGILEKLYGKTVDDASYKELYKASALSVRDRFMSTWNQTIRGIYRDKKKMLYYMSAEFLIGRSYASNIINMGLWDSYKEVFDHLGVNIKDIIPMEADPGLGNGGLGRLAACYLESLTSLDYPVMGCGIRYEYGLFKQKIVDGAQYEVEDDWLHDEFVWEVERPEWSFEVKFNGEIEEEWTEKGLTINYKNYNTVQAVPYDVPIIGYGCKHPGVLRLWSAKSEAGFDLSSFNKGDYLKAMENRQLAEIISKVLYPADNHQQGKELRLKQFYFLASAQMQFIVKYHKMMFGDLHTLPESTVVQINDTHPTLAIPELMRILMDDEGYSWEDAVEIVKKVFNYTNHTIMNEALECWDERLFRVLLPRIHTIIVNINERYCAKLAEYFPDDMEKISEMAIIAYGQIRMANLCIAVAGHVNGVSQLHGEILKRRLFNYEYQVFPNKFTAITNGITQRRWMALANPELTELLRKTIKGDFIKDYRLYEQLIPFADDPSFRAEFRDVKKKNKERLSEYLQDTQGISINTDSIIDVQSKRLHEYKRQLLKCIHILYKYNHLLADDKALTHPVTFIFAAKAAPGYHRAKSIIRLINAIADLVNNDPRTKDLMQVVFLENYNVSSAEILIPAADISEQLSTAGYEASGTGNMKFMLNGAVTIGTMDGANVEMHEQLGPDNIFVFGATATEIANYQRFKSYNPGSVFEKNVYVRNALDRIIDGSLPGVAENAFSDIYQSLLFGNGYEVADPYFVLYDLPSYAEVYTRAINLYAVDNESWMRKAIMNVAKAGFFSSDRAVEEYNEIMWHLKKYGEQ
ncbi:MAG: glycogen/starch/alpha-glucan phosphorylase [Lachnospiraceae bacterium]|nr:glycogen/starch/alpha-glucan phosphorylase [Lachnospiraceae bacterium]